MKNEIPSSQHSGSPVLRTVVTILAVIVSVALWGGILFQLLVVVPGYHRMFDEFRVRLPALSQLVIGISHWTTKYWYVQIISLAVFLMLGAFICWFIRHRMRSWVAFLLWILIWIVLPFALAVVIYFSMYLPQQALLEGLKG